MIVGSTAEDVVAVTDQRSKFVGIVGYVEIVTEDQHARPLQAWASFTPCNT